MRGAATKSIGHRRGAATAPIRALRRRAPSGCGPQGCGAQVPAGFVARSSHTAWVLLVARALPAGTAGRSPGGLQQKCEVISARALSGKSLGPFTTRTRGHEDAKIPEKLWRASGIKSFVIVGKG